MRRDIYAIESRNDFIPYYLLNERVEDVKRSKIFFFLFFLIGIFYSYAIFNHAIYAQDDDVIRLRKKVTELEARIKKLEGLLLEVGEKNSKPTLGWQNKMNWRQLEIGMNQSNVRDLLGEPIKIIQGVKTLWYYPNMYCGYCSFDEKGGLIGWNEP